jgi:thiaminase
MEVSTKGGYKSGIVLSVVILSKFSNQFLSTLVSDSYRKVVEKMTSNLYYYPDHWVRTGSTEDLRKLCSEIVADFDTKYLEESRKTHRQLMDILQKAKQPEENKP